MSCGAKFYDLARDPATCPKCGTIYQMASVAPSRVAAPIVAARPQRVEEEEEVETGDAETVSLEEVEAAEAGTETTADDADASDDETPADDTFLEEDEEGDDDVADLIDGDIENDEES